MHTHAQPRTQTRAHTYTSVLNGIKDTRQPFHDIDAGEDGFRSPRATPSSPITTHRNGILTNIDAVLHFGPTMFSYDMTT